MIQDMILTDSILFDPKPIAVPYNYRISYKIPQILMILSKCCSKRSGCSLIKLQMIATALSNDNDIKELIDYTLKKNDMLPVVRFDPSVNKALRYTLAENLVIQQKNGKYKLSDLGRQYVSAIEDDDKLMRREKEYLTKLGINITEDTIEELMSKWRYQNASNQPD